MSIFAIFAVVCTLAALVGVVSAVYAHMSAKDAAKAAKAMHEAAQRMAMTDAFEAACKRALLHDASVKATEVKLGLRARTGTRLGMGAFKA